MKDPIMENTQGETIRKLRKIKSVTQKELALMLGYSEAHISNVENGNRKISFLDLKKIAEYFNISNDIFFNRETSAVNFRSDDLNVYSSDSDKALILDFKVYAKKEIYGRKKLDRRNT